jgi:serine/threonine protein kinase/Flp pilus assembly protein TadD
METDDTKTLVEPRALHGRVISHYRLDQYLGQGGIGVVWKAEDVRLKRPVAIKLLSNLNESSPEAMLRFQIEAQAAAALDHPSVCTIYEIDHEDGDWFLAMACIEGQSLAQKIRSGPLDIGLAVKIASEVADGLAAAHDRNIIHRDIKSSNIMVTPQNAAKILDFGLAQVGWTPGSTDTGTILGTPCYMSPEQAQGLPLDRRTDIWSLGVVLYETLAGEPPFHGAYREALLRAIIDSPPPGLCERRPEIQEELAQTVYKALSKSPDDRYQTAREMRDALQAFSGQLLQPPVYGPLPSKLAYGRKRAPALPSVAVLPFANLTSDAENDYFSDGLTDELISALARINGVRVVSRTSAFAMKGRSEDVQHIGALLHASSVLEGSVRKAGNRLRINVQLVNVGDGFPLWSDRYDDELNDIFRVQDDITHKVISSLKVTLLDSDADLFASQRTGNMEVYKFYLQGQYHIHQLNPANLVKGLICFEEALSRDNAYAPAHAGVARYYSKVAFFGMSPPLEVLPKALAAASKALELDPRLAEAYAMLGEIILPLEWNWAAAEHYFQEATRLAPADASIRHPYAKLLMRQGRFDESYLQIKEALELDPLSKPVNNSLAFLFFYARRYEQALEACRKVLDLDPNYFETYGNQGLTYSILSQHDQAIEALGRCRELSRDSPTSVAFYAYVCGVAGRKHVAKELLADLLNREASIYIAPTSFAAVYVGLGDFEKALEYLERACEIHDPIALFLGVLHAFDPLRSDDRFARLLERVGLPATFHPTTLHMSSTSA